jgi:acetylornithine/succinyldiaminopimelate/putrescine aminotransferase
MRPAGRRHRVHRIRYNTSPDSKRRSPRGGDDICAVILEPMQGEGG